MTFSAVGVSSESVRARKGTCAILLVHGRVIEPHVGEFPIRLVHEACQLVDVIDL